MHVFVLSCKFLTSKHKNMHVSMYFLHLVLTLPPHYIIMVNGLFHFFFGGGGVVVVLACDFQVNTTTDINWLGQS